MKQIRELLNNCILYSCLAIVPLFLLQMYYINFIERSLPEIVLIPFTGLIFFIGGCITIRIILGEDWRDREI